MTTATAPVARNSADKYLEAMQIAIRHRAFDSNISEEGAQHLLEIFERAIPVAKIIVLTGSALDPDQQGVETFLDGEWDRIQPIEPDPIDPRGERARATVESDALYLLALAIGLVQSDRLL